ncbi:choline-sulfatase [Pseudomonas sp. W2I6]|nr:choline-sulfatase [Pseudomonas sp. W2I6]
MECRETMKRKNILFIMADQMAAPMLPFYGPSPIKLPNLSRLAAEGVVFDAAYCNSPLCAPSRFTLVSGQLPSKIGAYDNAADFPADVPTYAHYLRRLGYRTALSGKMHFCGPDQLHGYEERLTSDIYPADYGWAVNWDEPDVRPSWYHNMASVLQAGPCVRTNQLDFDEEVVFKAQQYLFDHIREDGDQPFCLTVSMTHPHDPYTIPKPFWDLYDDNDIPLPATPPQADLDPHSQRLLKVYDLWDKPLPLNKIRDARRAYFGACSYIDSNVGKLLQTLEDTGLADDTIIIFSGDHGDMLGERGLWYKMHWFEMAARVPLLISAPGQFAADRVTAAVSTADLLPTLVELAGGELDPRLALDGRSLVSHLQGQGGHDEVFGEYMAEGTISPLMMIRRGAYKFIYSEDDPCLLFDVHNDPHEREDLSQSPEHRPLFEAFLHEARAKWDIPAIHQQVLASQRRRRLVFEALTQGKLKSWDHQPLVDASQQYMRNHIDLDDLERKARFPQPCQNQ